MSSYASRSVSTADLELPMSELYRAMGYGDNSPEQELCDHCRELLDEACRVAKPSFYYSIHECEIGNLSISLDNGVTYESGKTITSLLRKSARAAVFVATAGEEFQQWMDQCFSEGEMLDTFIIDSIGTLLVEATGDYLERELEREIGGEMKHTNRFSPGYCGWRIEEQHKLFGMLPANTCGISLNDSYLMHPIKSISGVIGVGQDVITKKYGCAICKRTDCYMRK